MLGIFIWTPDSSSPESGLLESGVETKTPELDHLELENSKKKVSL